MLICWDKYACRETEDGDEEEFVIKDFPRVVVPDCCEDVQRFMTVILAYDYGDLTDTPAHTKPPPPPEGADWKERIRHAVTNVGEPIPGKTRFDVAVPKWSIRYSHEMVQNRASRSGFDGIWRDLPVPRFCPHCGTPLPEVVRRTNPPSPTWKPAADGDYCAVCDERSMNCRCFPPEVAWRPVTEKETT